MAVGFAPQPAFDDLFMLRNIIENALSVHKNLLPALLLIIPSHLPFFQEESSFREIRGLEILEPDGLSEVGSEIADFFIGGLNLRPPLIEPFLRRLFFRARG